MLLLLSFPLLLCLLLFFLLLLVLLFDHLRLFFLAFLLCLLLLLLLFLCPLCLLLFFVLLFDHLRLFFLVLLFNHLLLFLFVLPFFLLLALATATIDLWRLLCDSLALCRCPVAALIHHGALVTTITATTTSTIHSSSGVITCFCFCISFSQHSAAAAAAAARAPGGGRGGVALRGCRLPIEPRFLQLWQQPLQQLNGHALARLNLVSLLANLRQHKVLNLIQHAPRVCTAVTLLLLQLRKRQLGLVKLLGQVVDGCVAHEHKLLEPAHVRLAFPQHFQLRAELKAAVLKSLVSSSQLLRECVNSSQGLVPLPHQLLRGQSTHVVVSIRELEFRTQARALCLEPLHLTAQLLVCPLRLRQARV